MPKYEITYRDVVVTHEVQTFAVETETLAQALESVQAGEAKLTTEKVSEFNRTTSTTPEVVKCDGNPYRFSDIYTELTTVAARRTRKE